MSSDHDYSEYEGDDAPEHEASWRREHNNGEVTVVTVRRLEDVHVIEATDIDDDGAYPSEQVDVTRTREEAVRVAEEWMAEHGKGVKPGGLLGSLGLEGGDKL